ncbi:MAG: hypothetical protein H6733_03625 [Alphaproteobacteria bacterium]|nr:hypothetical protein [Alphaproteobacteria bacterium]
MRHMSVSSVILSALCGLGIAASCTSSTPTDDDTDVDTDTDTTPAAVCGNGVVEGDEVCDDTQNDGGEGGCLPGCVGVQTCGDGTTNGTEQCDDGGTADDDGCDHTCMFEGETLTTELTITCTLGEATLSVPVTLTTNANAPLVAGGMVTLSNRIVATITPSIGDLILAVGTDQVTVADLAFELTATGGDVSTITLGSAATPFTMDVDADDDEAADDYDLTSDLEATVVTHDGGTDPITLQLTGLSVSLADVPVLTTLELNVPEDDPEAVVQCELPEINPVATIALTTVE